MYIDESDFVENIKEQVPENSGKIIGKVDIGFGRQLELIEYSISNVKYIRITRRSSKKSKSFNLLKEDVSKLIELLSKID